MYCLDCNKSHITTMGREIYNAPGPIDMRSVGFFYSVDDPDTRITLYQCPGCKRVELSSGD